MSNKRAPKNKKDPRNIVISTRLTESEYAELLLKISDNHGNILINQTDFLRAAILGLSVNVADKELDRYRAFIAGKLSNNINQIAKHIHTQAKSNQITPKMYVDILNGLNKMYSIYTKLLNPLN